VPFLLKGIPLFLFMFRMWKRLPASQRRRVLWTVGRHGPIIAGMALRQARARRRRGSA
jgi:hypothetical protein